VEVSAKLPQDTSQDVVIEYYVVQHHHDWYGPMNLVIPMNTSSSTSLSSSPSTSPTSSPSQCPCPLESPAVCPSTSPSPSSSPSSSVKSEWSFETCQPPLEGSYRFTAKVKLIHFMFPWFDSLVLVIRLFHNLLVTP